LYPSAGFAWSLLDCRNEKRLYNWVTNQFRFMKKKEAAGTRMPTAAFEALDEHKISSATRQLSKKVGEINQLREEFSWSTVAAHRDLTGRRRGKESHCKKNRVGRKKSLIG
jgi:hypothetical protein